MFFENVDEGWNSKLAETLKQLIESGEFEQAIEYVKQLDADDLVQILVDTAYELSDFDSISIYFLVEELLQIQETTMLHEVASSILTNVFPLRAGAYNRALYHMRQAARLSPDNIRIKEGLLLFFDIPEHLLADEEARLIAKDVLAEFPDSLPAKNVLMMLSKQ